MYKQPYDKHNYYYADVKELKNLDWGNPKPHNKLAESLPLFIAIIFLTIVLFLGV